MKRVFLLWMACLGFIGLIILSQNQVIQADLLQQQVLTPSIYLPFLEKGEVKGTPPPRSTLVPTATTIVIPSPLILSGYQDTWIHSNSPTLAWGRFSNQILIGQQGTESYVGLAQFDLRDLQSLPTQVGLVKATLVLTLNEHCEQCINSTFSVSELQHSWLEDEATWNSMSLYLGPKRSENMHYDIANNQIRIDITELLRDWWVNETTHPNFGLAILSVHPVVHFKSHRLIGDEQPFIEVHFPR